MIVDPVVRPFALRPFDKLRDRRAQGTEEYRWLSLSKPAVTVSVLGLFFDPSTSPGTEGLRGLKYLWLSLPAALELARWQAGLSKPAPAV